MKKEKIEVCIGFDVSTSVVGICLLEEGSSELILLDHVKLNISKLEDIYDKGTYFKEKLQSLIPENCVIKHIFVEEAMKSFGKGMSSAGTIALLQRFNGIVSFMAYECFGVKPLDINVRSARAKLGIKIDQKNRSKSTKQKVLEIVMERHPEFPWVTNIAKSGKNKGALTYPKCNEDRCDAFIVALGGMLLNP